MRAPYLLPALLLLACPLCAAPAAAPGTTLYVARNGNDHWSGTLAAPNQAHTDGPLATLPAARDALRARRAAGRLAGPVTVLVRAGIYGLAETFRLEAQDGGTEGAPVSYRAYPGEHPVLTGGRAVRGFKPQGKGLYVADLAGQGVSDFRFRELFYRGGRQVLARFPNLDPASPVTGGQLYVEDTSFAPRNSFYYRPGSIPFETLGDLSQAEVNLHPYHCWDHNLIRISAVDPDLGLIKLRYSVAGQIFVGNRYFIQNAPGALDAPGEWFSDWQTGKLSFRPPDGRAPEDGSVTVPQLENLITVSGTAAAPVQYLTLHGFDLRGARQDAVVLEGARHCTVTANTITGVGGVGINLGYLRNAIRGIGLPWREGGRTRVNVHSGDRSLVFSTPCTDCRLAGNDVSSVGGEGLALFGERNVADNNHLYETGLYDRVCAGLTICGSANVASHNAIHDVPRDGIFINGKLNVAEYNEIRNSMLYTADNAAIALRQHDVAQAVANRGNVLRFNRLLDTIGYGSYPHCSHPGEGYASPFCSFGIYLDGSISGVTVYGNVIARTGATGLFIQFGGGNKVENNIFVEGPQERPQYDAMVFFGTFMFADRSGRLKAAEPPNELRHNIFSYGHPATDLYRVGHWRSDPEWDRAQAAFADNLIWHHGLPVSVCMHPTQYDKTLAAWQARGQDTGSLCADPLFVNAARDDYRLRSNSPAYRVGFRDINAELSRIGPYQGAERASWPLRNTVLPRERPRTFAWPTKPAVLVDGFELAPPGSPPARAEVSTSGSGSVLVSSDLACSGRQSLKFTDAANAEQPWQPHVCYRFSYPAGRLHCALDLQNSAEAPADFYVEFRDWSGPLLVGPTFRVDREGRFYANGRLGAGGEQLARVPAGAWFHLALDFGLGAETAEGYRLTLTVPGQPDLVRTLPFPDAAFRRATWFGLSATSTDRAVFYADNLVLGAPDAEAVRNAATAVALRGPSRPPAAVPAAPADPRAPAAHWQLDEAGGELRDSSGNGLHGERGSALCATGSFGRALYLDGGGGVATFGDSPLLQFGRGDFTLSCWLCPTALEIASEHQRRRLIEKGAYPATWWNVDLLTDGRVQMEMADDDAHPGTTVSAGALSEKAWTHVAIVVDRAAGKTRYFLGGKLDSEVTLPASFSGKLDVPGVPLATGGWQSYTGLLSDLRVYRRALSPAEVAEQYAATRGRFTSAEFTASVDD